MANFHVIQRNAEMVYETFPESREGLFFDDLIMLEYHPNASEDELRAAKSKLKQRDYTGLLWYAEENPDAKEKTYIGNVLIGYDFLFDHGELLCDMVTVHEIGHYIWRKILNYPRECANGMAENFCDTLSLAVVFSRHGRAALEVGEVLRDMRQILKAAGDAEHDTIHAVTTFTRAANLRGTDYLQEQDFKGLIDTAHAHVLNLPFALKPA
ncbi:MAG TPA: hypothetical protein VIN59_07315 [Alphaproteobacteria bacterium]